jgi:hypothetical protein
MQIRWSSVNATASRQIGSEAKTIQVGGIIVNSNTAGSFRLCNGTLTKFVPVGGTYTPTTAVSSSIVFEPLDFDSGCFMAVGGTLDATVLYRETN